MHENDYRCPICGEETSSYMGNYRKDRLCREHAKEFKSGLIEKCENCGSWHKSNQVCDKCSSNKSATAVNRELTCIICGEPSNGKHFCKSCYFKYKDRSVDIRISHCSDVEILDEYGNRENKCDNGIWVRSRAEKIIADKLFQLNIRTVYEKTVYYTDENSGEKKTLHPDFYLPDYDLFLEYNELTNKPYLKSKEYTKNIYKNLGLNVAIATAEDIKDPEAFLKPLLGLH